MTYLKKSAVLLSVVFFLLFLIILDYKGIIWHNDPFAAFYSVKGLDVSNHQGTIDWKKVANTDKYKFVYIKATEGHDYYDDYFVNNWHEARENKLLVGAYHFFSVRSSGKTQAKYFISHVPNVDDSLPPVLDIEIDISKDPEKIRKEIKDFNDMLENHYGKKPILYITYDTYNAYVKGHFNDYDIWIRDVLKPPYLSDRNWLMWQYSNRGHVDGIQGYVDVNVFKGDVQKLKELTKNIDSN